MTGALPEQIVSVSITVKIIVDFEFLHCIN